MVQSERLRFKICSAVRRVPGELLEDLNFHPLDRVPSRGDVVVGKVTSVGWHNEMEGIRGRYMSLFEGDLLVTVLGNRYATSEFEGRVPESLGGDIALLNAGGIAGTFTGKNLNISDPTTFEVLGYLVDSSGEAVNIADYGLLPREIEREVPVILVLGSGMDAGKTTTATSIIRALRIHGKRVNAGKLTGTSRAKDCNRMDDAGAGEVLDHVDAGLPSTYYCTEREMEYIFDVLYSHLAGGVDYIVLEVADSIFQRETDILLRQNFLMGRVSHIFFSASDAVAAYGAKGYMDELGLKIDAFSGPVANSQLMVKEAYDKTGICSVNPLMGEVEDIYNIIVG